MPNRNGHRVTVRPDPQVNPSTRKLVGWYNSAPTILTELGLAVPGACSLGEMRGLVREMDTK